MDVTCLDVGNVRARLGGMVASVQDGIVVSSASRWKYSRGRSSMLSMRCYKGEREGWREREGQASLYTLVRHRSRIIEY